ncbi:ureidoglycolate lyase [Pseudooceanicola marinus]|uniref:ureidoglycolate lyase n=1 Tax=Pseudooceanicola marinus TaxID=396013 RepID=UPI001CD567B0|nr:ureidoglycolate lyase [Pseudooceanicola marinus]MCA1336786.1 ureidoglycolate lyase [Pseudooceanicola marinus]
MPQTPPDTAPRTPATCIAQPLTPEAFAPHGDVARPGMGAVKMIRAGQVRLSKTEATFPHDPAAHATALDFYEVEPSVAPMRATMVERHPFSTQMFCPMEAGRWLVAVWPDGPEGAPEAFVAGPGDVVTYRPGLWHHGIVALDRPATFASLMWKTADGQGDTEFLELPAPVLIDWPAA